MIDTYSHIRFDLEIIADLIKPESYVLDLGCGTGDLLHKLISEKKCTGHGVEIHHQNICGCVEKGVPVIHADLDEGLSDYDEFSFDYVILSRTLQVVHKPNLILKEMIRIGKRGIVSFPNFGYYKVRSQLYYMGQMPVTRDLPYQWYDTPNIHLLTIKDFYAFCQNENIEILKQINLCKEKRTGKLRSWFSNSLAEQVIFEVRKCR